MEFPDIVRADRVISDRSHRRQNKRDYWMVPLLTRQQYSWDAHQHGNRNTNDDQILRNLDTPCPGKLKLRLEDKYKEVKTSGVAKIDISLRDTKVDMWLG